MLDCLTAILHQKRGFSTDQAHIEGLRKWYDELWKEGESHGVVHEVYLQQVSVVTKADY